MDNRYALMYELVRLDIALSFYKEPVNMVMRVNKEGRVFADIYHYGIVPNWYINELTTKYSSIAGWVFIGKDLSNNGLNGGGLISKVLVSRYTELFDKFYKVGKHSEQLDNHLERISEMYSGNGYVTYTEIRKFQDFNLVGE